MINHLFARPQDVEGSAFHLDLLRELEPAGDYTVEFRRMDSLWHTRSERPRPSSDTLLIWHYGTCPTFITTTVYDPDIDWARYCEIFSVERWAYPYDLLPYSMTIQTED